MDNTSNKLIRAPLKEVMLELHWELDFIESESIYVDKGFERALLTFAKKCGEEFGDIVLLKPDVIPYIASNFQVTHRFHKGENDHPVFQIGPGVFTINDSNKNYSWIDFFELCKRGISFLNSSFDKELIISDIHLRYLDRVDSNIFGRTDSIDFVKEHLNITIALPEFIAGNNEDIEWKVSSRLNDHDVLSLFLRLFSDSKSGKKQVDWLTSYSGESIQWDEIAEWLNRAHEHCSNTFRNMISSKLYEYFRSSASGNTH